MLKEKKLGKSTTVVGAYEKILMSKEICMWIWAPNITMKYLKWFFGTIVASRIYFPFKFS